MKTSWIQNLLIGLITTIVDVLLGWYLSSVYQQPEISYYKRAYYKIGNYAVGNLFLWNSGRKTDHNVSITFDADITDNNIKIVDLASDYKITHSDNKTTVIIEELKPDEQADISFLDDPKKDEFEITSFVSEHSNIKEVPLAGETIWWQNGYVFLLLAALFYFLGAVTFERRKTRAV